MAAGFRQAMLKLAALFAAAMVIGLTVTAAIGYFGVAIYLALSPQIGPAEAAAAVGGVFIVIAAVLALIARFVYLRQRRGKVSAASSGLGGLGAAAGLGGPLGAAALGASMGGLPNLDLKGALGRNAITVLLAAFVAGMVMNNRR